MYRVIRSVLIFSLVTVLASCEYWNKDMLGYLEYWSSTVQMGRVEVTDVTITKNDSGADTIPTSSTPTITGYIINPQSYQLVSTIGDLTSKNSAVRLTESVKGNAQIVGQDPTMLRIKLNPSDSSLEHTDFRVDFEAIRQETMQSAGEVMGVTLRYNTPPIAPTPIIKTESGEYKQPATGQVWEAYRDGNLYWAYDDSIKDEKDPNCAKWFTINGTRHLVAECKVPNEQVAGLSIFQFKTDYSNITVAAVDSEGVTGAAIVSGQVAPASITYNGNGNSYGDAPAPQSFERGTPVTIANQGNLRRSGYSFGGWNTNQYGTGDSYIAGSSYVFTENTTLYAVWNPMTEFFVSSSGTNDPSNDGSQQYPFGTVDKAVFYINEINDGTQNFIINVSGNCVAEEIAGNNSVVNIEPGQKLTLTIQGKDGQTATINANNHGRVMYVGANANVTLQNITLTGGSASNGGGVHIESGGSLTLSTGVTISGNTGTSIGGGVYSDGTLIMETGSSIKNNTANDQGGGVFINNGEFNMTGGTINGNTVTNGNGGGVFVKDTASTFNMSGGTISGNTATQGGGVYSTGILNMSGGTISGNTATQGGGVYIASGGSLTLNSGAIISGNTATDGKGVYNDGTFNISGSAIVNTNNDVYLPSGKTITVNSALTGSFPVATITPQTYISSTQVLSGSRVDKEFGLFKVTENSSEKWGVEATGMLLQYTSATNATDVLEKLVDGASVSFDMTSDTSFTPLDSYENDGKFTGVGKDYAIYVPENTTLVINGNGNTLNNEVHCGDLFSVAGTLVLNDVKITDTSLHWNVIMVRDDAKLILNNCIIEKNTGGTGTNQGGGVIRITGGGTAIMNGGKIEGNRLAGANIYDGGEFAIKGGVIQNNQQGGVRKEANATYVNEGGTVDKVEDY